MKEYEQQEEKNENIAKEPEAEYMATPLIDEDEFDLDNEEYYVQMREELEATYAKDRMEYARHPIPEGHMSLEEFDQLLQKKLKERHAEL